MKKYCLILLTMMAWLAIGSATGQNVNKKWGKPSQAEWTFQAWGEAPEAEAVILSKTMNVTYKISQYFESFSNVSPTEMSSSNISNSGTNNNRNVLAQYEMKVRTKILKDSGARFANIDINYYNEKSDMKNRDEIDRIKVVVYSKNEKDKVIRREVKPATFKEERLDDNYMTLHVTVPDVKAGDIIEYQYDITSARVTYLYDWSFQEEIPVMYANCDMDIPAFLVFDMRTPVHPFIKSKVEEGGIHGELPAGSMQAPKSYKTNHYMVEGHDILPKGLDLQRRQEGVDAARVTTDPGHSMKTLAVLKNPGTAHPAIMPKDCNHFMIGK